MNDSSSYTWRELITAFPDFARATLPQLSLKRRRPGLATASVHVHMANLSSCQEPMIKISTPGTVHILQGEVGTPFPPFCTGYTQSESPESWYILAARSHLDPH